MEEVWKDIPGYEGFYRASSLGRIRTVPRLIKRARYSKICDENITVGSMNVHGYRQISLSVNGVCKKFIFHRLIAITFLQNPENKRTINHKNGIKTDNRVENLEWATDAENNLHSLQVLGRDTKKGKSYPRPWRCKPVFCFLTNRRYQNATEIANELNIPVKSIRTALYKYSGKYKGEKAFEYC